MTVLDDIRAQYPGAYDDLTDGQLASMYRQKYYAAMDPTDFYKKTGLYQLIDANAPANGEPKADGVGTDWQNLGAGAGKAVIDTLRGAGQAALAIPAFIDRHSLAPQGTPAPLGAAYDQLKADQGVANERDAPLLHTKAGLLGDIAGNVGLGLVGGAALKGAGAAGSILPAGYRGAAATGAAFGATQPLADNQSELSRLGNAAVGGVGGLLGQGVVNGVGAAYRGAKGLLAPFFEGGQNQIVANTLQRFGGDAAQRAVPSTVPGVTADLAESTGDAGIAQLRRAVTDSDPAIARQFAEQQANNNAARLGLLQQVSGTAEDVANAKAWRDQLANQKYGQAFEDARSQQAILEQNLGDAAKEDAVRRSLSMRRPEMPTADLLSPKMQDLSTRPIIQSAAKQARVIAANQGVDIGNPLGSLQGQHYVKMALDDAINTAPQMGIGKTEQAAIASAKREFVSELERQNPAYQAARDSFRTGSAPANRMEVAQSFLDRATGNSANVDSLGNPILRPDAYGRAVDSLDQIAQKVTGQKQAKASGLLNPQQNDAIQNVLGDLSRVKIANNTGKSAGSNTVQNLASQNLLGEVANGLGLPGLADSGLLNRVTKPLGLLYKAFGTNDEIQGKLAQVIANPSSPESQAIIARMTPKQRSMLADFGAKAGGLLGIQAAPATNQAGGR